MLEEKSLPKFYWAEAVRTTVYIQNRIGDKVSAHELYFGRKPNLRHLRVFGSIVLSHCYARTCVQKGGITGVSNREEMEVEKPTLSSPIVLVAARTESY